jgi:hypothetical protein
MKMMEISFHSIFNKDREINTLDTSTWLKTYCRFSPLAPAQLKISYIGSVITYMPLY